MPELELQNRNWPQPCLIGQGLKGKSEVLYPQQPTRIFQEVMAATILQWNIRGLRSSRRDFDILVSEIQPYVICLQETKLDHSPHPKTYQCANYDCYSKALRRSPEQLPCGGVSIYIKKRSLPQAHPVGYSPSGCSGAGHTGKHTCQYPFCLHTKPWTPYNPRPLTPN